MCFPAYKAPCIDYAQHSLLTCRGRNGKNILWGWLLNGKCNFVDSCKHHQMVLLKSGWQGQVTRRCLGRFRHSFFALRFPRLFHYSPILLLLSVCRLKYSVRQKKKKPSERESNNQALLCSNHVFYCVLQILCYIRK